MKRPFESDYTSLVAYTRAIEEYCDALAQPEQKPDVVMHPAFGTWTINNPPPKGRDDVNLYYAPPQRKWVGLTVEEIAYFSYVLDHWTTTHIKGIEAKLKEKNT